MKILFLDSSYLQESLLGFFVSFFGDAKVVTSIKHCTKKNEKADLIIVSESVLGVDGSIQITPKESISFSSLKEKACKESSGIIGILTRIKGEHPIKDFVDKDKIVFVNDILKKRSSAIDLLENMKPSFSDVYIDCVVDLASQDISVGEKRIMPFVNSHGDLFSSKDLAQLFTVLCVSAEVYNILPLETFKVWVNKFRAFDLLFSKTIDPIEDYDYSTRVKLVEMYTEMVSMLPLSESSFHSSCVVGFERAKNLMPILSGLVNRSKQKILDIEFYIENLGHRYKIRHKILSQK